jgi:hypothetical protein
VPHFSRPLREVGVSNSKQWNSLGSRSGSQILIQSSKRQTASQSQLQIGRVIHSQPVAFRQPRSGAPSLPIRFRIHMNRKLGQIGKHSVAKICRVSLAPYPYLENICDL